MYYVNIFAYTYIRNIQFHIYSFSVFHAFKESRGRHCSYPSPCHEAPGGTKLATPWQRALGSGAEGSAGSVAAALSGLAGKKTMQFITSPVDVYAFNVYIYIYIYIYLYKYIHILTYIYIYTCLSVSLSIYLFVYLPIYFFDRFVYVSIYLPTYLCM